MASEEFTVVAVLYPKKGKADEVIALLEDVAQHVRSNEPGTLKYEINRTLRPAKDGTEEVVMIEKYKNKEALQVHGASDVFAKFQKTLAERDLIRGPPLIKMVSAKGGFASKL